MNAPADYTTWAEQNQQYLSIRLAEVRDVLERGADDTVELSFTKSDELVNSMTQLPALRFLAETLGLTDFEEFVLLLCAGYELDGQFAAALEGASRQPHAKPCFELAMSMLVSGHWSALTPAAPLRRWRLIELERGDSLVTSALRLDERILHYVTGISYLDARLQGIMQIGQMPSVQPPSLEKCVDQVVTYGSMRLESGQSLKVELFGQRNADLRSVALHACARMNRTAYFFESQDIPTDQIERDALTVLWQRESLLDGAVLIINSTEDSQKIVNRFVSDLFTPCILISREPLELTSVLSSRVSVPRSDSSEQLSLWDAALGDHAQYTRGDLARIVSQFNFSAQDITDISQQVLLRSDEQILGEKLWHQCGSHARKALDRLAERIESNYEWVDLVLPLAQKQTLEEIVAFTRHRHQVYSDWEFAAKSKQGQGGSCLFYGASGTGKTMAASAIANSLGLDLFRVDLSQVVNKYIGETEKNLARIFDTAQDSGAILLFDEADALFGKRTEIKSSNDRHANVGTSYLLQRMESYSGLAILTTNLKKEMDNAFMRRIRFLVQFPFPDIETRQKIWANVFPQKTPTRDLDFNKLASLDVAGGNIKNIALNAAFYAAEENCEISMRHLAKAARRDFQKLEKTVRETELRSWL